MDDNQREAMYNGWAKNKTFLNVDIESDDVSTTCSTEYNDTKYSATFYKEDCIGSATPMNMAFNRLITKMQSINKNIELRYPI